MDTGEQNNASEPTTPGVCRGLHITAVPFLQEHLETMLVGNRWVRLAQGAMAWCAPSCPWQKEGKSIPCLVGSPDKIRKKDATEQQAGLCVFVQTASQPISQYKAVHPKPCEELQRRPLVFCGCDAPLTRRFLPWFCCDSSCGLRKQNLSSANQISSSSSLQDRWIDPLAGFIEKKSPLLTCHSG